MNERRWIFIPSGCPAGTIFDLDDPFPDAVQGTVYSATITVTGTALAPFTFYILSGTLPPGLSLNVNTGAVTGTLS